MRGFVVYGTVAVRVIGAVLANVFSICRARNVRVNVTSLAGAQRATAA
jgi:hypothetical protein